MIYFDTTYMLKCYLAERGADEVRVTWRQLGTAACCEFGKMEFSAGIHRHCREGRITLDERRQLLDLWEEDQLNGLWQWLPLNGDLIAAVAQMFELLPSTVFLRTGDAIHLTCARENGISEIFSNDRHLKFAAAHFGMTCRDVVPA